MNLAHLSRRLGDCCRESDGQLLDAYLSGSQPAFRHLTDRHGPLVFGVCQRILRHQQDAEDAFQAVFLVLARRAADVWPREAVGSWLYGVAYRIALKARVQRTRQRRRELPLEDAPASCEPRLEPNVAEVVLQTIRKLPEVYRAAVVACHLQGLSRKNAARQLNWSEGTLSSRLARARQLLAERLLKTGVALPVAGLATALGTLSPLRAGLLESAMRVISSPSEIPAAVATLTQGVVTGLFAHKLKKVALAMLMTFTISYGAYCADGTDETASPPAPEKATRSPAKTQDPMVDAKQRAKPIEIERRGNPLMITTDDKEILDKLSKPSTSAQLDDPFKVIRLRKIVWAEGAARTITEILNGPQEDRDRSGVFPPGPGAFVGRVRVIAETSTNSIIVIKSSPIDLLTIEKLLGDQIEACEYISEKDINGPRADRVSSMAGMSALCAAT